MISVSVTADFAREENRGKKTFGCLVRSQISC